MDLVLPAERLGVGAAGLLWAGAAVCGLGPLWRMRSQQREALEAGGTITKRAQGAVWSSPPAFGKQDEQKGGGGQRHSQRGRGSGLG